MLRSRLLLLSLMIVGAALFVPPAAAQGGRTLFGDIRITGEDNNLVRGEVTLILRRASEGEVGRQTISSRGRYRFTNLANGEYELVVEADGKEIGRMGPIFMRDRDLPNSPYGFQVDLEFKWKSGAQPAGGVISVADVYERPTATRTIFQKAEDAVGKKKYDQAIDLLKQVVETDKNDFQAWTALGSIYFAEKKFDDAESAYLKAIDVHPASPRAFLNLGRLRSSQKKFEEAVEPLTKATELQPTSGDANFLLGECYLQLKKGSKAIPYLNEAARYGRPDAHLRLGWLYNAAGLKDKAAVEYEEYLKKNPDYPERNKLKEYITANKKS